MPIADPTHVPPLSSANLCAIEVRWPSLACGPLKGVEFCTPDRAGVTFVVTLQLLSRQRGLLEAWIETPERHHPLRSQQPVDCRVCLGSAMLHIDAHLPDGQSLAISLGTNGSPAYARTDLLAEAGLTGGMYDPPSIRRIAGSEANLMVPA